MRNPFMGTVVLFNSLERKIYSPHSRNLTGPVPSCRYSSEPEISTQRAAGGDAFSFSNSAIQHLRSRDSKKRKRQFASPFLSPISPYVNCSTGDDAARGIGSHWIYGAT